MVSSKRLIAYLHTAATEALAGEGLSGRSQWAIRHAISEIATYRDAVRGERPHQSLSYTLSAIPRMDPHSSERRITDVFLGDADSGEAIEDDDAAIAGRLDEALVDLRRLANGDGDAAREVLDVVSA